jgi:hypothetical protein
MHIDWNATAYDRAESRPLATTRRKPVYRLRNIALLGVVVGGAWVGLTVHRALTATPGRAVDYQQRLVDLAESFQKDAAAEPNAWPLLLSAIERLDSAERAALAAAGGADARPDDWPSGIDWPLDFRVLVPPVGPEAVRERTRAAMEDLSRAGLSDLLAELARSRRVVRPRQEGRLIEIPLSELARMRQLARACVARMYLAHSAGDHGDQVAAFEQALAVGRVACMQSTLLDRLTGIAIMALATGELRRQLTEAPPEARTGRDLLGALNRQAALVPPFSLPLEGERLMALDAVQWSYTDNGHGDGRLILNKADSLGGGGAVGGWTSHPIVNVLGLLYPGKAEATAKVNEYYDNLIALAALPRRERAGAAFDPDRFVGSLPNGHVVLRPLVAATGKALLADDRMTVEISGTRVMLALEIWRAERGDYPASLEDLVPSVLAAVPVDPFSGRAYGYRRLAGGEDPFGRRYLLSSVGPDAENKGGVGSTASEGKADREAGSAYILNSPREDPR